MCCSVLHCEYIAVNRYQYCIDNSQLICKKERSFLQCKAVCGSVWQCLAVRCCVLQPVAVFCSVLQHVAACCSVLQHVAVRCAAIFVLQCVAVYCIVLQCELHVIAIFCNSTHSGWVSSIYNFSCAQVCMCTYVCCVCVCVISRVCVCVMSRVCVCLTSRVCMCVMSSLCVCVTLHVLRGNTACVHEDTYVCVCGCHFAYTRVCVRRFTRTHSVCHVTYSVISHTHTCVCVISPTHTVCVMLHTHILLAHHINKHE